MEIRRSLEGMLDLALRNWKLIVGDFVSNLSRQSGHRPTSNLEVLQVNDINNLIGAKGGGKWQR